ncbi:LPP20 family lipoprotein [Myxococcota bacterium]|nr:LPP20 family lipoprotein [Myxococcota bacterium]
MNRTLNVAMRGSAVALMLLMAACGGSSKGAVKGPLAISPNAPEWVTRGSRVQNGSIFGVGSAAGIQNAALARSTAGNRGRAEISKILEVYSASLMKDFSESATAGAMKQSSESQLVSQAIKTFSANLLEGTEQKDAWVDPANDTIWVLIELNFERAKEVAAAKTEMDTRVRSWLDENGAKTLDDMAGSEPPATADNEAPAEEPAKEEPAKQPEPAQPPVKEPPVKQPPVAQPADEGPVARRGGNPPAWTTGACNQEKYLCGVGDGADKKAADIDARAELARIFQAAIVSVSKSFEGASRTISSKTGETWTETQNVSQFSMVSTEKVLTMSEIIERWDDAKGKMWSLAVIDRAQASASLRDQIQTKDQLIAGHVGRAREASDKLARFKALKQAVAVLAEREALNSDLRVIQKSGTGVPSPHDLAEILSMLDSAASSLKIGIAISGTGGDRVQACLEESLTKKGYQIEANTEEEDDEDPDIEGAFDVLIKATVKNELRDKIAGSEVVNTTVTVKLMNGKTNKVIGTYTGSEKASRPSVKAAASTSAYKICQKKIPEIVENIDRSFSK